MMKYAEIIGQIVLLALNEINKIEGYEKERTDGISIEDASTDDIVHDIISDMLDEARKR